MSFQDLAERLLSDKQTVASFNVVTGFDGFVDEMIDAIDERQSADSYRRIGNISAFADKIKASAGGSSLRETVLKAVEAGGCAVNLGDGLQALGLRHHLFATMGQPPHPVFNRARKGAALAESWGSEPGRTLAFEFDDGKLMFSMLSPLADFDAAHVREQLANSAFEASCRSATLIAMTDWSLFPRMTEVWKLLIESVYKKLDTSPRFFIDLVDPSSRSASDLSEMLQTLSELQRCGPVTLSLNFHEANLVAGSCDAPKLDHPSPEVAQIQASSIRLSLEIDHVVIHNPRYATVSDASETTILSTRYCENPLKSTGAGDRFNAGYILGQLLGESRKNRLALGCAASGHFVRTAQSPSLEDLARFLASWKETPAS